MARNYSNISPVLRLDSGVNNSVTTLTVDGDPVVSPDFTVAVSPDQAKSTEEVCLVTAVVDNLDGTWDLTVTRGYDGTTAKSHSAGAVVVHAGVAADLRPERFRDVEVYTGTVITKGDALYISGWSGSYDVPAVSKANNANIFGMPAHGIAAEDISVATTGMMRVWGPLDGLDLASFSSKDTLYVGATGALTNVRPTGSDIVQPIAWCVRGVDTDGELFVFGSGVLPEEHRKSLFDAINNTGSSITRGTPVYVSGFDGANGLPEVTAADASVASTMPAVGLADETRSSGGIRIARAGIFSEIATSGYSVGDTLWVSETAGSLTNVKPDHTVYPQRVGIVLESAASGSIILTPSPEEDFRELLVTRADYTTNALGTVGASPDLDLDTGNFFTATVSGTAPTFTFSNPVAADDMSVFWLALTDGGSETITWPASLFWLGGEPTFPVSGTRIIQFMTWDGGTTYYGMRVNTSVALDANASATEVDTGTATNKYVTPDALQGSIRNLRHVEFTLFGPTQDVETGTNQVTPWEAPWPGTIIQDDSFPEYLSAWNETAGTTGTMEVDVHLNGTTIMTTNKIDIETTEDSSVDAATQPDLTTTTFAKGDRLLPMVDTIHTTPAKGLTVRVTVRPD